MFDISFIVNYFSDDPNIFIYPEVISSAEQNSQNKFLKNYRSLPKDKLKIVFYVHDSYNVPHLSEDYIILHTSIVKSKKKSSHYSFPYLFEPIPYKFEPIVKTDNKPSISFCGYYHSHSERKKDIDFFIENQDHINTNFILLHQFWGGKPQDTLLIKNFRDNMYQSPFNLCSRGNGNFSMRFFQTLSCGRIPVLTDTDMEFPFENIIDYHSFCIINQDRTKLIDKIMDIWYNKNIVEIQCKAYEIYQNYFSVHKYPEQLKYFLYSLLPDAKRSVK